MLGQTGKLATLLLTNPLAILLYEIDLMGIWPYSIRIFGPAYSGYTSTILILCDNFVKFKYYLPTSDEYLIVNGGHTRALLLWSDLCIKS